MCRGRQAEAQAHTWHRGRGTQPAMAAQYTLVHTHAAKLHEKQGTCTHSHTQAYPNTDTDESHGQYRTHTCVLRHTQDTQNPHTLKPVYRYACAQQQKAPKHPALRCMDMDVSHTRRHSGLKTHVQTRLAHTQSLTCASGVLAGLPEGPLTASPPLPPGQQGQDLVSWLVTPEG